MAKITIGENLFPSDKQLYDMLMSQKIQVSKLRSFLISKGIYCTSSEKSKIVEIICNLVVDHVDLNGLMELVNTRESRRKFSISRIRGNNFDLNDIFQSINSYRLPKTDANAKLHLENEIINPDITDNVIVVSVPFKKFDYSRTELMQEQSHHFSLKIQKKGDGEFEIVYSTSSHSSESYFALIKDKIENSLRSKDGAEAQLVEIRIQEIETIKLNSFFDFVLKNIKNVELDHVLSVSFFRDDPSNLSEDSEDEDSDDLGDAKDEPKSDSSAIKAVKINGKNLLQNPRVQNYMAEGFVINSVTAEFTKESEKGIRLYLKIQLGFNDFKKFNCEIKEIHKASSESRGVKVKSNLSIQEKEEILHPINEKVYSIFEKMKKGPAQSRGKKVIGKKTRKKSSKKVVRKTIRKAIKK